MSELVIYLLKMYITIGIILAAIFALVNLFSDTVNKMSETPKWQRVLVSLMIIPVVWPWATKQIYEGMRE